jgi:hypothetical protein
VEFECSDDRYVYGARLRLWTVANNGPIVHPPGNIEHEKNGGTTSTGEDSWFVHQSSLEILPAESPSNKAGETGEGKYKFGLTK